MPLELAELKEKSLGTNMAWLVYGNSKVVELAKKHRIAIKALTQNPANTFTTVFKRSGFSYSKRLQRLVVSNNAMNKNVLAATLESKSHDKTTIHGCGLESHTTGSGFESMSYSTAQTQNPIPPELPKTFASLQDIQKMLHPRMPADMVTLTANHV